ncbi:MAG: NUDIX hydrolase [Hyphomicrobiaceae bacterium]|nr:NUDIX hydrolase [Hyphomicrobiaceae bacterium]
MAAPKTPLVSVDCVVVDGRERVLLIRRGHEPFKGMLALPGGFVDIGEDTESACRRELMEETGVKAGRLTLVGVYSDPARDPRRHNVSIAYLTRVASAEACAGDDAAAVAWVPLAARRAMAFDHGRILSDARRLLRAGTKGRKP